MSRAGGCEIERSKIHASNLAAQAMPSPSKAGTDRTPSGLRQASATKMDQAAPWRVATKAAQPWPSSDEAPSKNAITHDVSEASVGLHQRERPPGPGCAASASAALLSSRGARAKGSRKTQVARDQREAARDSLRHGGDKGGQTRW